MTDPRTVKPRPKSARSRAMSTTVVDRRAGSAPMSVRLHSPGWYARGLGRMASSPFASATAVTWVFFAMLYGVLRPGYWINDDLKMIWNIVGYAGGTQPVPFLIHSNVLLGFGLEAAYAGMSKPNWAMLLYASINLCSIWGLVYIVIRSRLSAGYKWIGGTVALVGLGAATLNLTFTFTAALSSLSGACLLLFGAKRGASHLVPMLGAGIGLLLVGALVRLEMLGLVLAFVLPGAVFAIDALVWRRLLVACGLAGVLIAASYVADQLYVRSVPEWHSFYAYDQVRENLHDAHRLTNLHNQIRHVGWTANDQELFAHWFYPDAQIYSFEHIKYLVENTAATSQDLQGTVGSFVEALAGPRPSAYLTFILAIAIWAMWGSGGSASYWTTLLPWVAAIAANLILTWAYKDPEYVLVSTLAGGATCTVMLLALRADDTSAGASSAGDAPERRRFAGAAGICLVTLGAAILAGQTLSSSRTNTAKQAAYEGILRDLKHLQESGKITSDALIVSPAHGLPYEWSYPFTTSLPPVSYFDTGWITFSPSYEQVLGEYGVRKGNPS